MATNYDFRILIETISGSQYSYGTGSFVILDGTSVVLTTSESHRRIDNMPEITYYNGKTFTTSSGLFARKDTSFIPLGGARKFNNTNIDGGLVDYQFVSCSVVGNQNSGSLKFTINETPSADGDYTKRYKFFGNKVCNVLGLPENYWIYSDSFRLSNTGSEQNYFSGDLLAQSVNVKSNFAISNAGSIETDLPFKHAKDSDRWIKWTDVSGSIPTNDMLLGYSNLNDRYELRMQNNDPFLIDSPKINLSGSATSSGNFLVQNNVNGGDAVLRIFNSNTDTGLDKGATIEFKHGTSLEVGRTHQAGKIVAGKVGNYSANGSSNSEMQFYVATRNTDTEKMRLGVSFLEVFNDVSITGEQIINHQFPQLNLTDDSSTDTMQIGLEANLAKFQPSDSNIDFQFLNSFGDILMDMDSGTKRIGIRQGAPAATLDVSGSFMLSHDIGVQGLSFEEPKREYTTIRFDSERLRFWSSGEKLTILSASANVGINAPNPTKALQVTGDVSASGQYYGSIPAYHTLGGFFSGTDAFFLGFGPSSTFFLEDTNTNQQDTRITAAFDGYVKRVILKSDTNLGTLCTLKLAKAGSGTAADDVDENVIVSAMAGNMSTPNVPVAFNGDETNHSFSAGDTLAFQFSPGLASSDPKIEGVLVLMYNVTD